MKNQRPKEYRVAQYAEKLVVQRMTGSCTARWAYSRSEKVPQFTSCLKHTRSQWKTFAQSHKLAISAKLLA